MRRELRLAAQWAHNTVLAVAGPIARHLCKTPAAIAALGLRIAAATVMDLFSPAPAVGQLAEKQEAGQAQLQPQENALRAAMTQLGKEVAAIMQLVWEIIQGVQTWAPPILFFLAGTTLLRLSGAEMPASTQLSLTCIAKSAAGGAIVLALADRPNVALLCHPRAGIVGVKQLGTAVFTALARLAA